MFFKKSSNHFQSFYQNTVRGVGGYFHRFGVTNKQDLEDMIQDTYIEAFKSFDSLEKPEAAKAWLYTIARRQFIRYLEAKRKSPKTSELNEQELPLSEISRQASADQTMYASFVCKTVVKQLEQIDDQTRRAALMMFFIELEPLAEISERLGINVSTLTTWNNRFRNELKLKFDRLNQEPREFKDYGWRRFFKRARAAA